MTSKPVFGNEPRAAALLLAEEALEPEPPAEDELFEDDIGGVELSEPLEAAR